jgi:hypothetical protein
MMAGRTRSAGVTQAEQLVHSLVDNGDFGHATSAIKIIETHISWVLLTGEYAYKIKKPVDLGFLDFSTLDLRHEYCLLELDLNRRFTPELYLDVVPIGGHPDRPAIGATPALEWAVLMRQFTSAARLDRQIEQGLVSTDDMQVFGESLARLHDQSPSLIGDADSYGSTRAISDPVKDNFTVLRKHCTETAVSDRLDDLADWCTQELARLTPTIPDRQATGRVRECHGDLHLENLVRLDGWITPFDCLEFDAALRCIDVINEVAFLLMDTLRIGRQDLGFSFLNRYLEVSGDYPGTAMLPFYCVYRCLVRAKVAVLRRDHDTGSNADVNRYLELAVRLAGQDHEPCLVICRGLSGSGKTHLSQKLLSSMPAIRIRSDIVRKRLLRIGELESSGSAVGKGLYDPEITAKTYGTLARFAAIALTAGYDVIVDATFLRRADRISLQTVATNSKARFAILDCTAEERILAERVEKRHATGHDASEADLAVLDWQRANLEPLSEDEQRRTLTVDTGRHSAVDEIARRLRKIAVEV